MCLCRALAAFLLLASVIGCSTQKHRRPERPSGQRNQGGCKLPQQPEHGFYFGSQQVHTDSSGTYVPHGSVLKYRCNGDYILSSNNSVSTCDDGVWQNTLYCIKLCNPIAASNAVVTCEYSGWTVACSKPMWPHTLASVRCKEGYKSQHNEQYGSVECGSDGQWSYPVDHCLPYNQNKGTSFNFAPLGEAFEEPSTPVPASFGIASFSQPVPDEASETGSWECGRKADQEGHETLILDGAQTYPGEFPWLTALYVRMEAEWSQICGGTLITPRIVLTAAHCLVLGDRRISPGEMKVGLGKYYRDYYKEDSHAIFSDVEELVVPGEYEGKAKGYVSDIGLIYLTKRVPLSSHVTPACYDWKGDISLRTGDVGHVGGWGTTENGTSSDTILSAQMTYITYSLCLGNIRNTNYAKYLTYDKFCAASSEGSQVNNGDSGGGITFPIKDRHFVFGVVSSKISVATTFSLFTDARHEDHHAWVLRERNRLERND